MKIPLDAYSEFINADMLNRGAQFFYNGQLSNILKIDEHSLTADASGQNNYQIKFKIEDKFIVEHHCSCPYTKTIFCKHKVALLIFLQENQLQKILKKNKPE